MMKNLLKILKTLVLTTLATINVVACCRPIQKTNFQPMTSINEKITTLITDPTGNIYAASDNGVYKCNAGQDDFAIMTGTSGQITALATDKDGNVYAGSDDGYVYKCDVGSNHFASTMTGVSSKITALVTDNLSGNVYAGSDDGNLCTCTVGSSYFTCLAAMREKITALIIVGLSNLYAGSDAFYKCDFIKGTFDRVTGTIGSVEILTADHSNNIYIGNNKGIVYKFKANNVRPSWNTMTGTGGQITALATDKDGNVYAGSNNGKVYKCNAGDDHFTSTMTGTGGQITALATDKDGNVYAGSSNSKVYKGC